MQAFKKQSIAQLIVLSVFIVLGISFSHLSLNPSDQMMSMDTHFNAAVCQSVCTYATATNKDQRLLRTENVDKEPGPFYLTVIGIGVFLISVLYYRKLYLLSSWRPPDIVLLSGKYGDSL